MYTLKITCADNDTGETYTYEDTIHAELVERFHGKPGLTRHENALSAAYWAWLNAITHSDFN